MRGCIIMYRRDDVLSEEDDVVNGLEHVQGSIFEWLGL